MIQIREGFPSKLLDKHVFPYDMEGIFVELNFRKFKWFHFGTYHPSSQPDIFYLDNLDKIIETYSNYEESLLIGDFSKEISEACIYSFIYQHKLHNLVKEKTCFKNVYNTSCTDLLLTNHAMAFSEYNNSFYRFIRFS